jgi:large subunit ribosomal protein L19
LRKFSHRESFRDHAEEMRPARLERATSGSGGQRSIQLSYGRSKTGPKSSYRLADFHRRDDRTRKCLCSDFQFAIFLGPNENVRPSGGSARLRQDYGAARRGIFMNQIIDAIEAEQKKSEVPQFSVGDSVRVHTRVVEGDKERIQIFAGIVIGRKGRGLNETFTVRRISYGEGVERVFPLHSPRIAKVEVEQQGRVRRARLNYLRTRKGKEATAVRE